MISNPMALSGGMDLVQVEPYWWDLLEELAACATTERILVSGVSDTGKTTLTRFLSAKLSAQWRTVLVDADPGQPLLGPPTTLGLAWEPWDGRALASLRFVGATSPIGHISQALAGLQHLGEQAVRLGAERIVVNSSGFVDNPAGLRFHAGVLRALRIDHIVALQLAEEMEPFLAEISLISGAMIHRLPVSGAVIERSRATRRSYRRERFADYFRGSSVLDVPLRGITLRGAVPSLKNLAECRNRLVAICDDAGSALALGIVEDVDPKGARLFIYAPDFERRTAASIQFGSVFLDRSGQELAYIG